ncbi:MAG: hypothetical protein Q4F17_06920 [Eubacteriales bacterium]|nr:hypothetical protein [Eubacteriales bacterium]
MRKWIALMLLLCLTVLLCACGGKDAPPGLEFRDIPWNSSPEAVLAALDLEAQTRSEVEQWDAGAYFTVTAENWKVFGETAVTARFVFYNFTPEAGDHFGLSGVQIFYPEDADVEAVLKNLRNAYGPEAQAYTLYTILDGEPEPREYKWEDGKFDWYSRKLAGDVLSETGKAAYRAVLGDITEAGFEACLASPAARITWREDFYGQFENPEELTAQNGNLSWLNFDAATGVMLEQKFESAP